MKSVQEDHHKSMDLLQAQLDSVEKENLRLQREMQQYAQRMASSPRTNEREKSATPTPVEFVQDFRHIERQEGEVKLIYLSCMTGKQTGPGLI